MKKAFAFGGIFLLLLSLFVSAYAADNTVLTAEVPSEITLHIEIEGSGTVAAGEKTLSQSGMVKIKRGEDVTLYFYPAAGYDLDSVEDDGKALDSAVKSSAYSIVKPMFDKDISVRFVPQNGNPTTGDSHHILAYGLTATLCVIALIPLRKKISI